MITTAAGYQTITPVGVINGGILPARDVAGDGSAHAIRAEDLCFAIEAVNERRGVFGWDVVANEANMPVYPSHIMSRTDWGWIGFHLDSVLLGGAWGINSIGFAVYPSASFADIAYTTTYPGATVDVIWPGSKVTEGAPTSLGAPVLDSDGVRKFFYALQFADRFCLLSDVTPWTGTATYEYRDGGTGTTTSCADGYFSDAYRGIGYRANSATSQYEFVSYGIQSASLSCTVPLPSLVSSAYLLMLFHLYGFDDSMSGDWWFTRKIPVTVTASGTATMPAAAFLDGFDLATEAASLGFSFPQTVTGFSHYNRVYITAQMARLVVAYDFRTEIRSLGWQWTP